MRILDLAGVGPLPDLPGIAAIVVPLLGLYELRRLLATSFAVARRRQRRLVYRFEGDAEAQVYDEVAATPAQLGDASAAGLGGRRAPLEQGGEQAVLLQLAGSAGSCTKSRRRSRCGPAASPKGSTWSAPRSSRSTRTRACG